MRVVKRCLTFAVILLLASAVLGQEARDSFGFSNGITAGASLGRITFMTGGGSYDIPTDVAKSGGAFRAVVLGSLAAAIGVPSGTEVQGRWDAEELTSQTFGFGTVVPNDTVVVLVADFYVNRPAPPAAGNVATFTKNMIVSDGDINPVLTGVQNFWVAGFGFGTGVPANFN